MSRLGPWVDERRGGVDEDGRTLFDGGLKSAEIGESAREELDLR
jgi:hypothetical protein